MAEAGRTAARSLYPDGALAMEGGGELLEEVPQAALAEAQEMVQALGCGSSSIALT
jgi:hypothetical protein